MWKLRLFFFGVPWYHLNKRLSHCHVKAFSLQSQFMTKLNVWMIRTAGDCSLKNYGKVLLIQFTSSTQFSRQLNDFARIVLDLRLCCNISGQPPVRQWKLCAEQVKPLRQSSVGEGDCYICSLWQLQAWQNVCRFGVWRYSCCCTRFFSSCSSVITLQGLGEVSWVYLPVGLMVHLRCSLPSGDSHRWSRIARRLPPPRHVFLKCYCRKRHLWKLRLLSTRYQEKQLPRTQQQLPLLQRVFGCHSVLKGIFSLCITKVFSCILPTIIVCGVLRRSLL